jgi:hypothetical protein
MMQGMSGEHCPFVFNLNPATFTAGDMVSYRVTGELSDIAFAGFIAEVFEDHIILASDPDEPATRMRASRESRPIVQEADIR